MSLGDMQKALRQVVAAGYRGKTAMQILVDAAQRACEDVK